MPQPRHPEGRTSSLRQSLNRDQGTRLVAPNEQQLLKGRDMLAARAPNVSWGPGNSQGPNGTR